MPIERYIDNNLVDLGARFQQGIQQSQDNKRQNALLGLERRAADRADRQADAYGRQVDAQERAQQQERTLRNLQTAFGAAAWSQDPLGFIKANSHVIAPALQSLFPDQQLPPLETMSKEELLGMAENLGVKMPPGEIQFQEVPGQPGSQVITQGREYKGMIRPTKPDKGISLQTDGLNLQIGGDGTPTYNPVQLQKTTRTDLEKSFVSAQMNSAVISGALAKWRPEFSTYLGSAKEKWTTLKEKLGVSTNPADRQYVADYTAWQSDITDALSQYLNQLSGAAISPHEEVRLKAGFPNANDGPTQFKEKAEATIRRFSLVQARAAYILSRPALTIDSISIEGMNNVIASEANKLAKSYVDSGMDQEAARQKAIQDTRVRFGIGGM